MAEPDPLAAAARLAATGDRQALEAVCRGLQDPLYRLALRMLSDPDDAADATQEVMVLVITNLSSFQGRSKLLTWAYTIATRHILRLRPTPVEQSVQSPEGFAAWLDTHRAAPPADLVSTLEFEELCGEVRIGCTYGMLLCLSRTQRAAYLLGDVLGLTHTEGGEALGCTPAAFRQQLSRARRTMRTLMAERCGLVRADNPCRCSHLVAASLDAGITDPTRPLHHNSAVTAAIPTATITAAARELDIVVAIAEVFRSDPDWVAPTDVWSQLQATLPTLLPDH